MDRRWHNSQGSKSLLQTLDDICDDFDDYDSDDLMKNDSLQSNAPRNVTQSTSSVNEETYASTDSINAHDGPLFRDNNYFNGVPCMEDDEAIEAGSDHSSTAFSLSDIFLDGDSLVPSSTLPKSNNQNDKFINDSENFPTNIEIKHTGSEQYLNQPNAQRNHIIRTENVSTVVNSNYLGTRAKEKQIPSLQTSSLGKPLRLKPLNTNIVTADHLPQHEQHSSKTVDNLSRLESRNSPHNANELELPTNLHTYTVLKEMHLKKEAELQQKLQESKAREEQYQLRIKSLESVQAHSSSCSKIRDEVSNYPEKLLNVNDEQGLNQDNPEKLTHNVHHLRQGHPSSVSNLSSNNIMINGFEALEKKYQVELDNMRIVAEQVQADADRRIAEAEKYMTEITKQFHDMQQTTSSLENSTLWRQRLEYFIDKLCSLKTQGVWVTKDESKSSFHQIVLEALQLGGETMVGNVLEDESWKEWISILLPAGVDGSGKDTPNNRCPVDTESSNPLIMQMEQLKNAHARVVQENASLRLAKEATEEENLKVVQRGIELEQVAEEAMKECEHLNKELCTLKSQLADERTIQGQLRAEIAHLKDELTVSNESIIKLQDDLVSHQSRIESLSDLQTSTEQKLCQLQSEQSAQEDILSDTRVQLDEKEKHIVEIQRFKAEIEDELICQKNVNTLMKRKMEAHESEISALKERTAVLSREKEGIERTLDQIRTENVSLSHNRTDVELECSRIRKELDEKNGTIEFYAKETTAMRREIFDVESERIRLSQLLDVTQQQKAAMSLQFEDKKAVIVDLSEEISKLNGQLQSLQSEIVVSEEKRRILSSEMDDINGLIASALNVTSSQSALRESAQHILHQLESFTFEKDTLEKKLSGMEQKHQLQKEELITSNNDLQKEIIALRNTFTSEMKNLEEKHQRDKKVLVEQFSQLNERNNQLLLDLNDLNMDYQRLKNESEQVSMALSQERDTAIISRNELQRECNQLRTDLVHLEKKKTSFLTEVQRITSPLISTSNPPRKYPSDKITVYRGSLNKTPHLSELRSSLQSTSSTTVDPEFIHADGTPQDSLSAIKHSLFSSNTDPVVEISVKSHENISSASDTTWKNDIETKLLALNSMSQRANDAMKSLQLLTKIENKSLVESPCMSIDTSQPLHSTVAEYGLKETEMFVQNLLFRN